MSSSPVPARPRGQMRASDADRSLVTELLGAAYTEGRLDREEYDHRIQSALSAKTFDDLTPLTVDLVPGAPAASPAGAPRPSSPALPDDSGTDSVVAVFSSASRKGAWRAKRHVSALVAFGGVELDFRNATFESNVCEVNVFCLFGGIDIKVPEGVRVQNNVLAVFGGADARHEVPEYPSAPTVVLRGFVGFGGVDARGPKQRKGC